MVHSSKLSTVQVRPREEMGNSANVRAIVIALCLLVLAGIVLTMILVQYYRHGRCFQKPRLSFSQNVLRDLKSIQLEFDPPFSISGMMKTRGNLSSNHEFHYQNMRTRDKDLYPAVDEQY
ncbi:small integral membrane protein 35-like isoform X2 [Rhincodon typus]|uniref:small integral membrane protein 35-like isoform X2 n=1 Tax=Rhincodon typus TaxID=259920 RepID=UPI00202F3F12|nr:small integral membrane protein 35-like isoform X2 [Rhincodon typus]